jgi:hypothetical protein
MLNKHKNYYVITDLKRKKYLNVIFIFNNYLFNL